MNERMPTSILKSTKKEKQPVRYTAKETKKVSNGTNTERNESCYTKTVKKKQQFLLPSNRYIETVLDNMVACLAKNLQTSQFKS